MPNYHVRIYQATYTTVLVKDAETVEEAEDMAMSGEYESIVETDCEEQHVTNTTELENVL